MASQMALVQETSKRILTAINGRFASHLVHLLAQPLQILWQWVPVIIKDVCPFIFALCTTRHPGSSRSVTDNKGLGTPTWILQDLGSDNLHPPLNSKFDIAY